MSFEPDNDDIDLTIKDLLKSILLELRITNAYNSLTHDEVITEEDIDED